MIYNVPLYGQKYRMSCWAASMRMILAANMNMVADDDAIASPTSSQRALANGLNPSDGRPLARWGFGLEAPQCYTQEGLVRLLDSRGPLWVAADVRFPGSSRAAPHIRVIRGVRDQQSPMMLLINDPGPVGRGSQYEESYDDFMAKNELLGSGELREPSPIYVAYKR